MTRRLIRRNFMGKKSERGELIDLAIWLVVWVPIWALFIVAVKIQ